MKIAAIYCRVSTDNQEREGTSLQTQLENYLTYCQGKGYDMAYRFSEAYSGLSLERPELDKLRARVISKRRWRRKNEKGSEVLSVSQLNG